MARAPFQILALPFRRRGAKLEFAVLRRADLAATSTVPVSCIDEACRSHWPHDLVRLPNHAFAVDCSEIELTLSAEHTEHVWVEYTRAYDGRLARGILPTPE